ncbi:hypothetical protein ASF61_22245 [Duganella sp. Leaf126]|nr:hypothetical protein ASF61_22245 [Duganella sp. Leaf126]
MRYGNVRIAVHLATPEIKEKIIDSLPQNISLKLKKELPWLLSEISKTEKGKNGDVRERNKYRVAQSRLQNAKESIAELDRDYKKYSVEILGNYGFSKFEEDSTVQGGSVSIYQTYLFKDEYVYIFQSREEIGEKMSVESHGKQFSALLKSFRTRRMNEIPTELGVCIPLGFLPDDGRTVTDIKGTSNNWLS